MTNITNKFLLILTFFAICVIIIHRRKKEQHCRAVPKKFNRISLFSYTTI